VDWFQTLGAQVTNITPMAQKVAPDLKVIYGWVDALGEGAIQMVERCVLSFHPSCLFALPV
jgi:folate-dependent phosphoribosylglycinamide formyltransferase PurN